jgi:hypothetical protein
MHTRALTFQDTAYAHWKGSLEHEENILMGGNNIQKYSISDFLYSICTRALTFLNTD